MSTSKAQVQQVQQNSSGLGLPTTSAANAAVAVAAAHAAASTGVQPPAKRPRRVQNKIPEDAQNNRPAGIGGHKRVSRGSKSCPSCGKSVGPNTRKCPSCGHVFPFPKRKTTKRCHNCHRSVNRNSRTCLYCRAALPPPGKLPPPKQKPNSVVTQPQPTGMTAVSGAYCLQSNALAPVPQFTSMQQQTGGSGPPPLASLPALGLSVAQQYQHQQHQQQQQQHQQLQQHQQHQQLQLQQHQQQLQQHHHQQQQQIQQHQQQHQLNQQQMSHVNAVMSQMQPQLSGPPPETAPADQSWLSLANQSKQKETDLHRVKA